MEHLTEVYTCDLRTEPYGDQLHCLGLVSTVIYLNPPWGRSKMRVDLTFVENKRFTCSTVHVEFIH